MKSQYFHSEHGGTPEPSEISDDESEPMPVKASFKKAPPAKAATRSEKLQSKKAKKVTKAATVKRATNPKQVTIV